MLQQLLRSNLNLLRSDAEREREKSGEVEPDPFLVREESRIVSHDRAFCTKKWTEEERGTAGS